jgi:hypothetical protein
MLNCNAHSRVSGTGGGSCTTGEVAPLRACLITLRLWEIAVEEEGQEGAYGYGDQEEEE